MLKALEESSHANLIELAEALTKITRVTITDGMLSNNLSGVTAPDRNRLILWAEACNVDEDWLIGDYVKPPGKRGGARKAKTSPCMSLVEQTVTHQLVPTYLHSVIAA
jgi:transcriptional regulator with XRE-family HTH domain